MFTPDQLEILETALGEYMTDAYGTDNAEGCFTPEHWAQLEDLSKLLFQARMTGRN